MDYRITETFRSKVRRNVRLREYYRSPNYIYIYIHVCIHIRSYLSAFFFSFFKFYVDITRLVIILVCAIICAKWTSKDEKKKKRVRVLPFAVSLDNGDFSHEERSPRHLTVTCRVLTASTRQHSRVGATRYKLQGTATDSRVFSPILSPFSRLLIIIIKEEAQTRATRSEYRWNSCWLDFEVRTKMKE